MASYKEEFPRKWEVVVDDASDGMVTRRLKVPDGWLVAVSRASGLAMSFVRDVKREWHLK